MLADFSAPHRPYRRGRLIEAANIRRDFNAREGLFAAHANIGEFRRNLCQYV